MAESEYDWEEVTSLSAPMNQLNFKTESDTSGFQGESTWGSCNGGRRGGGIFGAGGGKGRGEQKGGARGPSKCYNCNEDGHMSRECPNPKVEKPRECYKCKETGHTQRDCPQGGGESTWGTSDGGSRGGAGGGSKCYNCNEDGHMSRDCPNPKVEKPRECYKCKETGHTQRDCPQGGGSSCRKCGEIGHFARDCTNPAAPSQNGEEGGEAKPAAMTYVPVELEDDALFGQGISAGSNFSAFENVSVKVSGNGEIPRMENDFSSMNLRSLLLSNVQKAGYEKPLPIQKHSIPIVMGGRDLMGCAQTGSGKTAAFLLPILNFVLENNITSGAFEDPIKPTALVISPTRELAIQIFNEARKFSMGSIVKVAIVYGGTSVSHQHKTFQRGCHILVATPGRLLDFVERSRISFECLKFLVLDEADRMLDMGFRPAIEKIVGNSSTPDKASRQTLMFSATFAPDIQELAKKFLNDYVFVVTGAVGSANVDVKQTILNVEKTQKREELLSFLKEKIEANKDEKILVFVETKRMADFIALYLSSQDVNSTSIHGDRFQNQREEALSQFKLGIRNVLVATAVAARGLDIKGVGIVVNFDMPKELDEYVHRIGRTGRVGNTGVAISYFDTSADAHLAKSLVKLLGDAEQEVPEWLIECASQNYMTPSSGNTFGARDIRKMKTEEFSHTAEVLGGPTNQDYAAPQQEEMWD